MSSFKKVTEIIRKTGDKLLILDENDNPGYVIMSISDYERLILGKSEVKGLTEDEFLDKINRDIAIWKSSQDDDRLPLEQRDFREKIGEFIDFQPNYFDFNEDFADSEDDDDSENEEDRYYFEPVE